MFKEGKRRYLLGLVLLIIASALVAFWFLYQPTNYLEFSLLDVGQGDAILIQTPTGKNILIDGGPDNKVIRRLSEELPFWQRRLDLVILTHPHDDHYRGLIEVFKRYQVDNFLMTDVHSADLGYQELLNIIKTKPTRVIIHDGTETFNLDGLNISALYPLENVANKKLSNLNNSSIVLKLSYQEIDWILTGDAEVLVEKELLVTAQKFLSAEILKLGHHGSDTSSSEDFLKMVNPQIAIISVGLDNAYSHPSPLILKRLERLGIKKYLTKDSGTINLITNGQWLKSNETCLIANCPL